MHSGWRLAHPLRKLRTRGRGSGPGCLPAEASGEDRVPPVESEERTPETDVPATLPASRGRLARGMGKN